MRMYAKSGWICLGFPSYHISLVIKEVWEIIKLHLSLPSLAPSMLFLCFCVSSIGQWVCCGAKWEIFTLELGLNPYTLHIHVFFLE